MTRHDTKNKFIQIVVTGSKGGTGKTTITALLTEYLLSQGQRVHLVDADPTQVLTNWFLNCQEKGRSVSQNPADCQITDVAGVSGAALTSLKQANIILVPFISHYADLQVIIPWFNSLSKEQQEKVYFLPNRYQRTKEQQEGLKILRHDTTRPSEYFLSPLPHRPALFSVFLNGSEENFFSRQSNQSLSQPFQELFSHYENKN